jgi:glucose/mannose-6-phosphate isomerase
MLFLESDAKSRLERIFDLIYLGDWVSYYLAILNNTDPTPVEAIEKLKVKLISKNK